MSIVATAASESTMKRELEIFGDIHADGVALGGSGDGAHLRRSGRASGAVGDPKKHMK